MKAVQSVLQREELDAKRNKYILTERQAIDFANFHGISITKGTKAFNVPATGQTILIWLSSVTFPNVRISPFVIVTFMSLIFGTFAPLILSVGGSAPPIV